MHKAAYKYSKHIRALSLSIHRCFNAPLVALLIHSVRSRCPLDLNLLRFERQKLTQHRKERYRSVIEVYQEITMPMKEFVTGSISLRTTEGRERRRSEPKRRKT